MAIKAQGSATVYDFNDVKEVVTWYKTVSRTSSAPTVASNATESQMTTNGWSKTEPAVDTTKKLYTVQQTVFGDNSYVWGTVNLSSSYEAAIQAYNKASGAESAATTVSQYFWHKDGTGTEAGAHVTEIPQSDFETTPSGGNLLLKSNTIYVRDATNVLASFGSSGATIGREGYDNTRLEMSNQSIALKKGIGNNEYKTLAFFGYDEGAGQSGRAYAPYFTFGIRQANTDNGNYSSVLGEDCEASGWGSVAEGYLTSAYGNGCHAEGRETEATSLYAHAEGYKTKAQGGYSHSQNFNTVAGYNYQTAIGKWNDNKSSNIFEIGIGTGSTDKKNALEINSTNGNMKVLGDIYIRNHYEYIGYKVSSIGTYSCPSNTSWNTVPTSGTSGGMAGVTLNPGTWIVVVKGEFESNATGRRALAIYDATNSTRFSDSEINQTAINGALTKMQTVMTVVLEGPARLTPQVSQNSGSAKSVSLNINATRIA